MNMPLIGQTLADRYDRAHFHFDAGDYIEAANELAPIVEEAPTNLSARLLLARACYHSAQLRRAESVLREVIEQAPTDAYAHLLLGRTLQRQSRGAEAETSLRLAAAMGLSLD